MLNIAVCQVHEDKTKGKYILGDIRIYEINSMNFFTCFFFFYSCLYHTVAITASSQQMLLCRSDNDPLR